MSRSPTSNSLIASFEPERAASRTYEEQLSREPRWALIEGSKYFEEKSAVWVALRRIAQRLTELGIQYAVVGGIALFRHGYRRFTEDVDILVTKKALKEIHKNLEGRGYLPAFTRSKNLRDTELGVKIEFLTTGDFPGDGKPKPMAFPDPGDVQFEHDGISFVNLPTLIELKIASGMSGDDREQDLLDVRELIKVLNLTEEFAEQLNPYVCDKYRELWKAARPKTKRYVQIWRNKFLTLDAKSLDEMIVTLQEASETLKEMRRNANDHVACGLDKTVETLKAMQNDGVFLDPGAGTTQHDAMLVTNDPEVAKRYGMHDEAEYMPADDDDENDNDSNSSTNK